MDADSGETIRLLERAAEGDKASLRAILDAENDRLSKMIALRIDPRLAGRIDVADVVQEVHIEVWQHLRDYLHSPSVPFYFWLRGVASKVLLGLHRRHLGTKMRDARREVPLHPSAAPETSSYALAALLIDSATSPSQAAMRAELGSRLHQAVNGMEALDREVLALRHFEQLTPAETAHMLQISEKAAGMRYLRAIRRLKEILNELPAGDLDSHS